MIFTSPTKTIRNKPVKSQLIFIALILIMAQMTNQECFQINQGTICYVSDKHDENDDQRNSDNDNDNEDNQNGSHNSDYDNHDSSSNDMNKDDHHDNTQTQSSFQKCTLSNGTVSSSEQLCKKELCPKYSTLKQCTKQKNDDDDDGKEKGGIKVGTIIGVVVGGIVALGLIAAVVYCCCCRRCYRNQGITDRPNFVGGGWQYGNNTNRGPGENFVSNDRPQIESRSNLNRRELEDQLRPITRSVHIGQRPQFQVHYTQSRYQNTGSGGRQGGEQLSDANLGAYSRRQSGSSQYSTYNLAQSNPVVARMPSVQKQSYQGEICCICLEKMNINCSTVCGHFYHSKCLLQWSERNQSCPKCRSQSYLPGKIFCTNCGKVRNCFKMDQNNKPLSVQGVDLAGYSNLVMCQSCFMKKGNKEILQLDEISQEAATELMQRL